MAFLIDIEGTDGCGKQTQSTLLTEKLKSLEYDVIRQAFPNYESLSCGPVKMFIGGEFGDVYSLDPIQISTMYAVDRLCTMRILEKKLKEKSILVLDRYTNSNLLHQATKIADEEEREKCVNWIENFEYGDLKLPRPNLVIFLDMPPEQSIKLSQNRELKSHLKNDVLEEDKNYQALIYKIARSVCEKYGWIVVKCVNEDNTIKTKEEIHNEIMKIVFDKLEKF